MKSNLDVWAVQSDKEETRTALKNVKKNSLGNILYLNCHCFFNIGNKKILHKDFDSCFYSEESDTVIFFERDRITRKEIENYLIEANIKYTTITFQDKEGSYEPSNKLPDIWFVREKYVLEDAIRDSKSKGIKECIYSPSKDSKLSLGYRTMDGVEYEIEGRIFKGMLVFEDKMVLLVHQNDLRNLNEEQVSKILKNNGISVKTKNRNSDKR